MAKENSFLNICFSDKAKFHCISEKLLSKPKTQRKRVNLLCCRSPMKELDTCIEFTRSSPRGISVIPVCRTGKFLAKDTAVPLQTYGGVFLSIDCLDLTWSYIWWHFCISPAGGMVGGR